LSVFMVCFLRLRAARFVFVLPFTKRPANQGGQREESSEGTAPGPLMRSKRACEGKKYKCGTCKKLAIKQTDKKAKHPKGAESRTAVRHGDFRCKRTRHNSSMNAEGGYSALIKPTASRGPLPFGAGLGWREAQTIASTQKPPTCEGRGPLYIRRVLGLFAHPPKLGEVKSIFLGQHYCK